MERNMTEQRAERKRIGATLAFVRKQRELKQDELAECLGIARPYLANIEAGRRSLSPSLARKASKVLGIRPIVLVNEDFLKSDLAQQKTA
ncbi:helix-turn-helix transcriptional regulator [Winkia sp. UMB1096A]|jgi:transcriptional regulator with XRE-family HTH domain|nr:helix-turn-helix transcriptional regulator [Winkia sp. UMB1096A]